MSTTSIAHQPDTTPDLGSTSVTVYVTDLTTIRPSVFTNGAALHITAGDNYITLGTLSGTNSVEDFEVLERFLRRCLTAVDHGRRTAALHAAHQLPCGGVCKTVTWNSAGTWVCGAVTPDGAGGCTREENHTGEHVCCGQVDGEHTVRARWTAEAA